MTGDHLDQLRVQLRALEDSLLAHVQNFEQRTGLTIMSINVTHQAMPPRVASDGPASAVSVAAQLRR